MEDSRRKVFSFTWRIENLSMCARRNERCIVSPTFIVDFLENTEWNLYLILYSDDYVDITLQRSRRSEYTQNIIIDFSLVALSTQDGKNIEIELKNKTFSLGDAYGSDGFCTLEKIFDCENGLLPSDTFTIRCLLSKYMELPKSKDVLQYRNADIWKSKLSSGWHEASARTRVNVSFASFVWPIERIEELSCDQKVSTSVPFVVKNEHSFELSLKLTEDSDGDKYIQIEMHKKNSNRKGLFVRCHIITVGAPSKNQFQGKDDYYFPGTEDTEVWIFPTFLNMKHLRESYFNHTYGTLYLRFDLSFSTEDDIVDYENISERFPLLIKEKEIPYSLATNFQKLYKDGDFVDTTLNVRDREFKVHKLVLIAGSDVFRSMFKSDMEEQNSGVVEMIVEWIDSG